MQFGLLTVAVIVVVVWYAAKADERADVAKAHGWTLPNTANVVVPGTAGFQAGGVTFTVGPSASGL